MAASGGSMGWRWFSGVYGLNARAVSRARVTALALVPSACSARFRKSRGL
uniref:Uncharacterized protein n=1 Tax=Human herpesvirus 1 TaxID=10298 RepID=A0A2U9A902_HHV1|nr:hypothetical protein [Human alphaherpesvirus 1]AWW08018.1 hypothetical protein [Human alphaherpesvirus 1]AWW08498.1 hypothetical protein [Human alphaherpesvirus 1]AWW09495.1 hypothetical protein [Human alphaherpesvirus 1]AWW13306.1 hypothetical protein [Human alphaherpesvirus 1]